MRCIVVWGRSSARISSLCDCFRSPEMEISSLKTVCSYPCSGVINKSNVHNCFVLAFCHFDVDVCIYSTCAFFDCQMDFDVDNVQHRQLVNIYGA